MVALGLVGISESELAHRLVELGVLPEIPADRPRVACLRMRTRQHPTAHLAVDRQHLGVEGLDQWGELHVAQLADVEMPSLGTDAPAEKQIRGGLHQLLSLDYPLAMLSICALAGIGLQHRGVGFLELQKKRIV